MAERLPLLTRSTRGNLEIQKSNTSRSQETGTRKKRAPLAPMINVHEVVEEIESLTKGLSDANTSLSSIFVQLEELKEIVKNLSVYQKHHMEHDYNRMDQVTCWLWIIIVITFVTGGLALTAMLFSGRFIQN